MEEVTVAIRGMSCGGCVKAVERSLAQVEGVSVEDVSVGSATVSYDPMTGGSLDAVLKAIEKAGFEPVPA